MKARTALLASCLLALSVEAGAAGDGLDARERGAVVQTLAAKVKSGYVSPEVAERVAAAILKKEAAGGYAGAANWRALSAALMKDLREQGDDRHFSVFVDERFQEVPAGSAPDAAEMEEARAEAVRGGYGIGSVQRLPGNVGYIELLGFGLPEFVGGAYAAAMQLLAGTDALIIDLRRNDGGEPASVAYLMSMFFPLGQERHLNDIHDRLKGSTQQYWTLPTVAQRYDKPVYVLTSKRTFSAGEECAYDFQTQKRGTVVGEVTGGGANPVTPFSIGHGIVAAIPTGRAVNPVTKTSWEHVGVKPDVAADAAQAQQVAYVAILRRLAADAKEPRTRARLERLLGLAEKGDSEAPVYTQGRPQAR